MTTTILEMRPGTTHRHIDEASKRITYLTDVVYELQQNQFFTEWVVNGINQMGNLESIVINRAGLNGESRACGIF